MLTHKTRRNVKIEYTLDFSLIRKIKFFKIDVSILT